MIEINIIIAIGNGLLQFSEVIIQKDFIFNLFIDFFPVMTVNM